MKQQKCTPNVVTVQGDKKIILNLQLQLNDNDLTGASKQMTCNYEMPKFSENSAINQHLEAKLTNVICQDETRTQQEQKQVPVKRERKKKEITNCPHKDQKHYAKGMCNHCYHLYGRNSLADKCPHTDRNNYAKGMCQSCYFNIYNTTIRKKQSKSSVVNAASETKD